jgi:16S rRNA (guanine527-N7)-methyltransferase
MRIDSAQWRDLLRSRAEAGDIHLNDRAIEKLVAFVSELLAWNEKTNLTAITDPDEIAEKHVIDSLIPAKFIPENASVLDIGSGGGLPGIALKIYKPTLCMTLIDSSRKKVNFLKHVIRQLGLQDTAAVQVRAESLRESEISDHRFDFIASRAVTSLEKLILVSFPVLKNGGLLIAMKGKPEQARKEVKNAQEALCLKRRTIDVDRLDIHIEEYHLPVSGNSRSLVMLKKLSEINY